MQVLVLQPPDPPDPLRRGPRRLRFVPAAPLLHLSAHLQVRSRHPCRVLDANLLANPLPEIAEAIASTPDPKIIVVRAEIDAVVETVRLLEACAETAAGTRIVLFGSLPTHAPAVARTIAPEAWLIRGDPEPAVKAFLDYVGLPQRLEKVPGLCLPGAQAFSAPAWIGDLRGYSLEALHMVSWLAASLGKGDIPHDAVFRLSRGQTGLPPDRDDPGAGEPLRIMDLKEMTLVFEKCASWGVSAIHLDDPPAVWTPERLRDWLASLDQVRNTMAWSLRMLPTLLAEETMVRLRLTECRTVVFDLPSVRPEALETYGCILRPRAFAQTLRQLRDHGIDARLRFSLGGPGEPPAEEERIFEYLRAAGYPEYEVRAFPAHPTAPARAGEDPEARALADLYTARQDPTAATGSAKVEHGQTGLDLMAQTATLLEQRLRRSIVWNLKHNWDQWNPFAFIKRMESLAASPR